MLFWLTCLHKLDGIMYSIVLYNIRVSDMGRKLAGSVFSPFLKNEHTWAFFQYEGTVPLSNEIWNNLL